MEIKILATKSPQRYAVRKAVVAACEELRRQYPDLQVRIEEVRRSEEILDWTPILIYPSLVVDGRLVCKGRIPRKNEIVAWLRHVLDMQVFHKE